MGVWDKDKAFAPDGQLNEFAPPETKFILWAAEIIDPTFETEIGTAPMMHLTVSTLKEPDKKLIVSSIGDTNANKFFDKDDDYKSRIDKGDFPAIVETRTVPASQEAFSDAFVIRFVDYFNKNTAAKYVAKDDVPF
jgi:hypothetical protein